MDVRVDGQALDTIGLPLPAQHAPVELLAPVKAETLTPSARITPTGRRASAQVVATILRAHPSRQGHPVAEHDSAHPGMQDGHRTHSTRLVCHVQLEFMTQVTIGTWVVKLEYLLLIVQ